MSIAEPQPLLDHRLQLEPGDLLRLPDLPSIGRGFGKIASCRRVIREVERRSDVGHRAVARLRRRWRLPERQRPRVYHVCADIWAFAAAIVAFRRLEAAAGVAVGGFIDRTSSATCFAAATCAS